MRTRYSLVLMFIPCACIAFEDTGTQIIYEYEEEQDEVSPIEELSSIIEIANTARSKGAPIL